MATMGFQPFDMNGVHVVHLPAHATPTFKKGDAVYITSGTVQTANNDQEVFGVAAADGVASASTPVYVADPSSVWVGSLDTTSVATCAGAKYGLNIGTPGSMSIDYADTTTTSVRVIDLHPADGAKALGRLLFCWRTKAIQNDGAA